MTLHQRRTHPVPQPDCFGCRVATVQVNNSAQVKDIDRSEIALRKDLDAYRNFRRSGLQPQHVKGSAELERQARTPLEVEHPRLMGLPDEARKHAAEAAQIIPEIPSFLSAHGV